MKNNNLKIVILTVILPLIVRLFFLNYISNQIEPSLYGKIVLIELYIIGITSILNSILYQAYNRFYNDSDKEKFVNEFRSYLLIINLISAFVLMVIGLLNNYSLLLIIITCTYAFSMNNYLFFQNIYFINIRRKKFLFIKLLEGFIKFLFPIISFYLFETIESFLIGIVFGYSISNLFIKTFLKLKVFKFNINKSNLIKYLRFGYPIILASLFSWSISFVDRFFLEAIISISIVGIYSILSQLSGFAQILGSIYSTYINPIIFKNYAIDKKKTIKMLYRYLKILSLVCLFVFTIICLTPRSIFSLIISDEIIQNSTYYYSFLILTLGIFLAIMQTALSMYFVLLERLDIHSKIFGLAAAINFVLNFSIYKYGVIAAAISTALAYLIINILILFWLKSNLKHYEET